MIILHLIAIVSSLPIIFMDEGASYECSNGRCSLLSAQNSLSVNVRQQKLLIDNHLPREYCDNSYFTKKVINPYNNQELPTQTSDFKSGCLQCAACLVIAEQINDTLQNFTFGTSDPLQEMKFISNTLNTLCNDGFYNYDLKNHEGYSLVYRTVNKEYDSYSDHEKWPKKLKEICNKYMGHINIHSFYINLLNNNIQLKDLFCRSDSIFRDCANVNYRTLPATDQSTNKKIIFKIECML